MRKKDKHEGTKSVIFIPDEEAGVRRSKAKTSSVKKNGGFQVDAVSPD